MDVPDGLAALGAMFFGITVGVVWLLIKFGIDWFTKLSLERSNADTMAGMITNDLGAICGALALFWWYRHRLGANERQTFGSVAEGIASRLTPVFARHGVLVGMVVAVLFAAIILAGWLADRPYLFPAS